MTWSPLPQRFFERPTLQVARALLGQLLVLQELPGGSARVGRIVETEAYLGPRDLACHSSKGRTARTEVMFGPAGRAYVYLVYGMHNCFNVVTGKGAAVLIRALEPVENLKRNANGPGRLTQAMGITLAHNGLTLARSPLWLAKGTAAKRIARGPRIGVDYAREWAARPYRFWEAENPHVSVRPRAARV
jgi:DNA-3-methyladenine glycosylase